MPRYLNDPFFNKYRKDLKLFSKGLIYLPGKESPKLTQTLKITYYIIFESGKNCILEYIKNIAICTGTSVEAIILIQIKTCTQLRTSFGQQRVNYSTLIKRVTSLDISFATQSTCRKSNTQKNHASIKHVQEFEDIVLPDNTRSQINSHSG